MGIGEALALKSDFASVDLDDIRLYNCTLVIDEVTNLYNNTRVESGLVGEWLFEESSGGPLMTVTSV